ncbi:MAG: hypothetical protein ACI944_002104, partial [Natronomonas sp.]
VGEDPIDHLDLAGRVLNKIFGSHCYLSTLLWGVWITVWPFSYPKRR